MIASLHGTVIDIKLGHAVIECGGVGYLFLATPTTLGTLTRGEEATVLTTLVVREDAMTLYGFTSSENRDMFSLLQTVSGLGPKLALAAQSVYSASEIAGAIAAGDHKALTAIPGVGKRMAERMVVDLKDKVSAFAPAVSAGSTVGGGDEVATAVAGAADVNAVVEALTGLGFTAAAASGAVSKIVKANPEAAVDTSSLLKATLASLGKRG
ncbi:MAG: Holliday junction branch migration protein RuvA [Corynebacterium sp.]|nr:Holliday junction branch migration protein RuvA [Corynebacterium sp.]